MADPVRNIYIDNRMGQYEGYIPDDWAPKAFGPIVLILLFMVAGARPSGTSARATRPRCRG